MKKAHEEARQLLDHFDEIQKMWDAALAKSVENVAAAKLAEAGVAVNEKTESGSIFSVRDVLSEADQKKVAKQMPKVIDRIAEEIIKPGEVKYSGRDAFYAEYDAWDKKNANVTFVTGTTSDALKSIGMKDQNIVLRSGTVLQKIKDHPEMTFDIFKGHS